MGFLERKKQTVKEKETKKKTKAKKNKKYYEEDSDEEGEEEEDDSDDENEEDEEDDEDEENTDDKNKEIQEIKNAINRDDKTTRFIVVDKKDIPTQEIRQVKDEKTGEIINLVTIEEAITELLNRQNK